MPDDCLNPMANDAGWPHIATDLRAEIAKLCAEIERLTAENERLRGSLIQLLKMPAACTKDEEVIENVNRRKLALDLIGGHRTVHQQLTPQKE